MPVEWSGGAARHRVGSCLRLVVVSAYRVLGRAGSGSTVAGLPLATALWAATQSGLCSLVVLMVVLVFVVLALTFAPWIPLLRRLPPPIGAPTVRVTFVQVPPDEHRFGRRAIVLEVGVK